MVKCMKGKKKGNTCQKTNWLWEMIREVERERERERERWTNEGSQRQWILYCKPWVGLCFQSHSKY